MFLHLRDGAAVGAWVRPGAKHAGARIAQNDLPAAKHGARHSADHLNRMSHFCQPRNRLGRAPVERFLGLLREESVRARLAEMGFAR